MNDPARPAPRLPADPSARTGPHVLVMTDVVDSTRLTAALGDAAFATLWAAHDEVARGLLHPRGGLELDKTDGFALTFPDVPSALDFAQAYHRGIAALTVPLSARVAVHVGDLVLRENPPEVVARGAKRLEAEGLARPTVARLLGLAGGGQTLLGASAAQALGDGGRWRVVSHGHWRLKGIEAPVEVFEAGDADTPFAPPQDVDKAYRVVRDGDLWRPLRDVRHTLPAERDAFVGRADDLRTLSAVLQAGHRLVTVLGPGGTGKTRFACRYGRAWRGDWPGGVWFCDLSEARSLDGVLGAVAMALGVPLGRQDAVATLGHAIAGRGRCLVVLDNFEQVVEHAAATLGHWLDRAGDAAFVVTSRERLHLRGEQVLPLAPLPLDGDAVTLFALRATAQRPDFVLGDAQRGDVRRIVTLLDGLPLAIELAAARVRVLSVPQLLDRLKARFVLLAGARGAAHRQATLRAAIDWSWDLLTPWEQAALAQCAVFEGGFTLPAAEAVLDLAAWPDAPPPLDVVQSLVDKSLLRHAAGADRLDLDEPYFGMYLSIHEYAAEKLAALEAGGPPAAAQRHGVHFAALGEPERAASRLGVQARRWHQQRVRELDNLVVACRRALARGDAAVALGTARAAWEVLDLRGPFPLGQALADALLALPALPPALRGVALELRARVALRQGRVADAEADLTAALALHRASRDDARECVVTGMLGNVARNLGRMDEALALLEQALAGHRRAGRTHLAAPLLPALALTHGNQGRMAEWQACLEEALALYRQHDAEDEAVDVHDFLGVLHAEQGRLAQGRAHFETALASSRATGSRVAEGQVLTNLGCLHLEEGRLDEARRTFEAALVIHREVGNRRYEGYALGDLGRLCIDLGDLPAAEDHLHHALAIHREVHDRRIEGSDLRSLGDLHARAGRLDAALATYTEAEAVLREVSDRLYLAFVHCGRAEVLLALGRDAEAAAAQAEAEALAHELRAGEASELGRRLAALRVRRTPAA